MANPGLFTPVTPMIGKLQIHIQNFVDTYEFYIMPLPNCDVLLGIPWHYDHKVVIDTFAKTITIYHRGKTKTLKVSSKAESIPIVTASAISSIMKNHISAYLIFVKDKMHDTKGGTFTALEQKQSEFLFSVGLFF